MGYRVVITEPAKYQLEMYIAYVLREIKSVQAARAIRDDARKTMQRLSDMADIHALCENETLAKYGYRRISFAKHDYFMVYRIDGNLVIIDVIYHELQDYESVFAQSMSLE